MDRIEWNQSADSLPESRLEETGDTAVAANQAFPVLERLVQKVELPRAPHTPDVEAVINKVIELGENNLTVERILERKHEVKDFATAEDQKTQHASRLGELLEAKKGAMMPTSAYQTRHRYNKTPKDNLKKLLKSRSLYGYAIRYGFVSGLLALVIAILAVVLFT